ncbi:hypothetical protein TW95_gp1810 [Pandoravirus inopinatum]|uniref:Uncharacterized protein n=1 Tax=Pandoravirus inopinatum TaxID=1605721 RepID=A0A0B5J4J2_9VIRU|nr:hypothetical protein TW95_gp1810 [Pandoravirus inopinatum]AJF98544.1 hypothetical protein [Pandoravirus inopinatum]
MEGVALVTVWTADVDEKPLAITIPCRDADAAFSTMQALIVQAYASAHPDRPALRFYPDGSYVATDAARELVFHADQKVSAPSSEPPPSKTLSGVPEICGRLVFPMVFLFFSPCVFYGRSCCSHE